MGLILSGSTSDNIHGLFERQAIPIPDPLYLKNISFLQQIHETPGEHLLRLEADALRLIDLQAE